MADDVKALSSSADPDEVEAAVVASVDSMAREVHYLLARMLYPLYAGRHRKALNAVLKQLKQVDTSKRNWRALQSATNKAGQIVCGWRAEELRDVVARILARHEPDPDSKICIKCEEPFSVGEKIREGWCAHCEIFHLMGTDEDL